MCRRRSEARSSTHSVPGRGGTSSVGTATPVIGSVADVGWTCTKRAANYSSRPFLPKVVAWQSDLQEETSYACTR